MKIDRHNIVNNFFLYIGLIRKELCEDVMLNRGPCKKKGVSLIIQIESSLIRADDVGTC